MALAKAMLRSFFRDRMALFFTFLFPVMFLVVFGLVFNSASSSVTTIGVVGSGPLLQQLPHQVLEPEPFPNLAAGVQAVKQGDVAAVVTQEGDRLVLRFAASDMVKSATIQGVLQSVVDRANVDATGQPAEVLAGPGRRSRTSRCSPSSSSRAACSRGAWRRPRRSGRR